MNAAFGLRFTADFFFAAGLRLIVFFAGFFAAFFADFFFVAIVSASTMLL